MATQRNTMSGILTHGANVDHVSKTYPYNSGVITTATNNGNLAMHNHQNYDGATTNSHVSPMALLTQLQPNNYPWLGIRTT